MDERTLTQLIIAECGRRGLLVHHCKDARLCEGTPGVPDLIIASVCGVVMVELKTEDGETSADQDLWAYVLYSASHTGGYPAPLKELRYLRYRLWRPSHWNSGVIQRFLEDLASLTL